MSAPNDDVYRPSDRELLKGAIRQLAAQTGLGVIFAGLVNHGGDGYSVTPSGSDLLKRVSDLQAFAAKWVTSQGKKK